MRIKNTRAKQRIFIIKTVTRWLLYFLLIFLSFIFMTSGTWRKPILFIPIALCISMYSGQISSAFTGAVCGFLIDISSGKLFGYNAIILSFFCIFVSLMFELYLRNKFINITQKNRNILFLSPKVKRLFPKQDSLFQSVTSINEVANVDVDEVSPL